ncbi:hypothetical protein B5F10_20785, partial [Anaerotruncus colihominis]|uniref:hypothetical protein n=1 Tax=Anaerotruncus colihominis TaxID=169435 RepID=UPI000B57DE75
IDFEQLDHFIRKLPGFDSPLDFKRLGLVHAGQLRCYKLPCFIIFSFADQGLLTVWKRVKILLYFFIAIPTLSIQKVI